MMGMKYIKEILCTLMLLLVACGGLFAQSWSLPDNRSNDRYFNDQFNIPRPALSMRSFDNTQNDSFQHQYSSTTYGVRQVLEKAYGIGEPQVESVELVYREFVRIAALEFKNFNSDGRRDINSRRFEARAFVALMSFIIKKNPNIFTSSVKSLYPNMPNFHTIAMDSLRSALQVAEKGRYFRQNVDINNPFKRSVPLMKVARAWDLYLALENAYEDLGGNTNLLLNSQEKQEWNAAINAEMNTMWHDTRRQVAPAGVNQHEIVAGNWPLISFVTLGYVALGFNGTFFPTIDDDFNTNSLNGHLKAAMKSAAFHYTDPADKRFNYWWYQTSDGDPFLQKGHTI